MDEYLIGVVQEYYDSEIIFEWNNRGLKLQGVHLHLLPLKQEVKLYIYFYQRLPVSEYFAFLNQTTKNYFLILLRINYIGPKLSLRILNTFSLLELQQIIMEENVAVLAKVKGVTNKLASVIIEQCKNIFFGQSNLANKKN